MTRLTQEQIATAFNERMFPRFASWHSYSERTQLAIVEFAETIAALAVQDMTRYADALKDEVAGFEWGWEQREKAHDAETEALRAQLATAKREAFKSGMVYGINAGPDVTIGDMLDKVDAQYPATPSGEWCDADCGCKPPEAREVPEWISFPAEDGYVTITPADAKRIVAMGTE